MPLHSLTSFIHTGRLGQGGYRGQIIRQPTLARYEEGLSVGRPRDEVIPVNIFGVCKHLKGNVL